MADTNTQLQQQDQKGGMLALDALTKDDCLVNIARVKNLLPQSGYEGLTELLGLLEEVQVQWLQEEQSESTESNNRVLMLDEILVLAELHLEQTHGDDIIDDLLFGVAEFCTGFNLTDEDLVMFKTLLQEDGGLQPDAQIPTNNSTTESHILQKINLYQDQINHLAELSETKGLSGIQDILFAIRDWLEFHFEQQGDGELFTEGDVAGLEQLTTSVTSYFTLNDIDSAVQQLFEGLGKLQGEPIVPLEDIEEFSEVLISEITAQSNPDQDNPKLTIEDASPDLSSLDSTEDDSSTDAIVLEHLNEFIELLQFSVVQVESSLDEMLSSAGNDSSKLEQTQTLGEDFETELNKFSGVTSIAGFEGLNQSCEHIQDNYLELNRCNFNLTEEHSQLWRNWIEAVVNYLQSPLDQDLIQQLIIAHCAPDWLSALSEEKTAELLVNLKTLGSATMGSEYPQRQKVATDEDVSLQPPDDVYPELLESLLQELPDLTEQFSKSIQFLGKGEHSHDLIIAQRVAHTIKGAGNTVGIKGIANLTHHLEDILTALTKAETLPGEIIINSLIRAADCLEEMSEALITNSAPPPDAKHVLQEILDLASRIDREGCVFEDQQTIATFIENTKSSENKDEPKPVTEKESAEATIRVPISIVDKLMQFSNEVTIINGQLRENLRQTTEKNKAMNDQLNSLYGLGLELEELVDIRNYDLLKGSSNSTAATTEFDALEMDQYNELHTCSRRIHEVATDIKEMGSSYRKELTDINNLLIEQGHLNHSSQNDLLTMRLVPVQTIIPRLQRSVRQACRLTGKNVDLEITGSEILMDRDILNGVVDPLMHVLRNAVDHGIETEENRVAFGKKTEGTIKLDIRNVGNQIEIQCLDDGAGLNFNVIHAKGIERGIIEADAEINEDELKQLIFQPNFSTSENVTQVSGRGVGMDAVNSGIRALGGSLHLESIKEQGCDLTISLPSSLVYYHSVLVKVGTQRIALAERSIKQILHPGAGSIQRDNDEINFVYENQTYPVKTLDALLTGVSADNRIALEKRIIILVQQKTTEYAVLIESIEGVTELVVKGLGEFVPEVHGVIGASILDDGSIAPVLDVQELLEENKHWSSLDLDQIGAQQDDNQSCVLVVDDSLSARRSLEQFVGDLGFTVMAARDGQEAIEMINERIPEMVITDMEMPRINGIELTEFLRANPETSQTHIPIIMITSRSTGKHKQLAQSKGVDIYLTKPYSEQELTSHVIDLISNPDQSKQAATG